MEGDTLVRKYYSEHECLNETLNTLLKACSQIVARDNVIQLPVTQQCKFYAHYIILLWMRDIMHVGKSLLKCHKRG